MKRLVEIRNQEFLCRERAVLDSERKIFWLAKADVTAQRFDDGLEIIVVVFDNQHVVAAAHGAVSRLAAEHGSVK